MISQEKKIRIGIICHLILICQIKPIFCLTFDSGVKYGDFATWTWVGDCAYSTAIYSRGLRIGGSSGQGVASHVISSIPTTNVTYTSIEIQYYGKDWWGGSSGGTLRLGGAQWNIGDLQPNQPSQYHSTIVTSNFSNYINQFGELNVSFDATGDPYDSYHLSWFKVIVNYTLQQPDLIISNVSNPTLTPNPGDTIAVTFSIKNQGAASAGAHKVGFYLSANTTINTFDTYLGEYSLTSLAAGVTQTYTKSITIPSSTSAGYYYIGAIADYLGSVTESDENNNTNYDGPIDVTIPKPDLIVSAPSPSSTPPFKVGQSVTWSVTVTNQDTGTAASSYVGYYLGTNSSDLSDRKLSDLVVSLSAGSSANESEAYIFTSADIGTRYLIAKADYNSTITESNENNNTNTSGSFTVMDSDKLLTVNISPTGGGTVNPTGGTYTAGTQVTLTATPSNGYTFSSWSGIDSSNGATATVTMNTDKTVTATFTQNLYSLTINITPVLTGTVTKNPNQSTYTAGTQVTLTSTPNSGYTFSSWGGDASGTTNPTTITMDSNKSVTATFTQIPPNQYTFTTINVNPAGAGSVTRNPDQPSYTAGTQVTLTATANTGYTFSSWGGDASGTSNTITITMNSNKSVTANFTTPPTGGLYSLDTSVSPTSAGSVSPPSGTYTAGTQVTLTATANSGYTFSSWSGDATGSSNPTTVTMTANKTVTANFFTDTGGVTITTPVNPSGMGSVSKDPDQASYTAGTAVNLTATPVNGYSFSSWSGSVTGTSNPLRVIVDANISVTANFTRNPVISVYPPTLDFGEIEKGGSGTLTLQIANTGGGTLSGTIAADISWLKFNSTSFNSNNISVTVTADNAILNKGSGQYTGTVTINSNGGTVTVSVKVKATCVLAYPNPFSLKSGKVLTFWGTGVVPWDTQIRIYTLAGDLVKTLTEKEGADIIRWDGTNESGDKVVPGIYVYTSESPKEKDGGRITVIK